MTASASNDNKPNKTGKIPKDRMKQGKSNFHFHYLLIFLSACSVSMADSVKLCSDPSSPQIVFAVGGGTQSHGTPSSWKAEREKGKFQVAGNRLMINVAEDEGVFETAEISLPSGVVDVSLDVQSAGGLDSGDQVKFYFIVDGGKPELVDQEIRGSIDGTQTLSQTGIKGKKIKLRIESEVSASDEFYFFDNLKLQAN